MELTVIMPCLNEAETLEKCIEKANKCITENNLDAEILIADNGSTDGSIEIAMKCGARVVNVENRGYGAALIGGIEAANGKYCIMGDADDSYDFSLLMSYVEPLRQGADLVMGNRYKGGIEEGAMPLLHRYLGTPVISFIGRLFYNNNIRDFNCGMRGFNTNSMKELGLISTGMEFASEMIVKSSLAKYTIVEVPTTLSVDGRSRKPYLNTWSDGWRHLKFLLLHAPNWLFLYPGIIMTLIGLITVMLVWGGPLFVEQIAFDINTMLFAVAFFLAGVNAVLFSWYARVYAVQTGYIVSRKVDSSEMNRLSDWAVLIGVLIAIVGVIIAIVSIAIWKSKGFGELDPRKMMRVTIPSMCMIVSGIEIMFGGFFTAVLQIKHN